MKLSQVKELLPRLENVSFKLQDHSFVPEHFHVTEVGVVTKTFIDCGGQLRKEELVNFQLWDANDHEHRLKPGKLLKIISLSENMLGMGDLEIEVEYQSQTIGKYDLGFDGINFLLLNKQTACLAQDNCGAPASKQSGAVLASSSNCCSPDGSCC